MRYHRPTLPLHLQHLLSRPSTELSFSLASTPFSLSLRRTSILGIFSYSSATAALRRCICCFLSGYGSVSGGGRNSVDDRGMYTTYTPCNLLPFFQHLAFLLACLGPKLQPVGSAPVRLGPSVSNTPSIEQRICILFRALSGIQKAQRAWLWLSQRVSQRGIYLWVLRLHNSG